MNDIKNPITGIFIFGKEIKNNGKFISEGTRPVIHIQTDKYSGGGVVKSKETKSYSEKWYQKWWGQIVIAVIGGLILWFITKK